MAFLLPLFSDVFLSRFPFSMRCLSPAEPYIWMVLYFKWTHAHRVQTHKRVECKNRLLCLADCDARSMNHWKSINRIKRKSTRWCGVWLLFSLFITSLIVRIRRENFKFKMHVQHFDFLSGLPIGFIRHFFKQCIFCLTLKPTIHFNICSFWHPS